MMKLRFFTVLLVLGLVNSAWADGSWIANAEDGMSHNWYLGVGGGATFPNVNQSAFVPGGVGWPADRYMKHTTDTVPLVSFLGGYTWARYEDWFPFYTLGANYSYAFTSKVHGIIHQVPMPAFNDYSYTYSIQRQSLMALFKADIYRFKTFMPYVVVSGGLSRNKATHYTEQAFPGIPPRVSPGYGSANDIYGAYTVGAGLDYILTNHVWASLEYSYGDYGYVSTGKGTDASLTPSGFNFSQVNLKNKLTANNVVLNLIYYMDN